MNYISLCFLIQLFDLLKVYRLLFFSIFLSTYSDKSKLFNCANLRAKKRTSDNSSPISSLLSGSFIICIISSILSNLNMSKSSPGSVLIPIPKSFGLWNRSQFLASRTVLPSPLVGSKLCHHP